MFNIKDREHVGGRVLDLAKEDMRVVAGAVVGSLALSEGDRWSDLDLTFAVAENVPIMEVLEDWTRKLITEFDAIRLFDLPAGQEPLPQSEEDREAEDGRRLVVFVLLEHPVRGP